MELTEKDKKYIREEMRAGTVFSAIILCLGGIFNVLYFATNGNKSAILFIVVTDLIISCGSVLVFFMMNRKLIKDLMAGTKQVVSSQIEKKKEEISYEAGSGNLRTPVLGSIFPKVWGQKMKENKVYFFIIENRKFDVEKTMFDTAKEGDAVAIYYSQHSEILLGIELQKSKVES